jgi:hypothetical protein
MLPVSLRKTKQTQSREIGNIEHTRRRQNKQTKSRETGSIEHKRRRKTKQTQSRETGSIGVFLRLLCSMLPLYLDCVCLFCLLLVCPMLPVSLDCVCLVCTQDVEKLNKHNPDKLAT